MTFEEKIEDMKRVEEIVEEFVKQGFYHVVEHFELVEKLPFARRILKSVSKEPTPVRLRKALEKLGPTFIKLGQALAERPDLIPEEYTEELEKLEDRVEPIEAEKIVEVIEDSFGKDLNELFKEFQEEAVASASIAQVHKAKLDSGEEVAVKVMKPGVKEQIKTDLRIMEFLVKEAEFASSYLRERHIKEIFGQFKNWTLNELDLREEGRNADKFRKNLENDREVYIPEVYWEQTNEKVLTLEYLDATRITNVEELQEEGVDVKKAAENGIRAILKQILRDGFFHADPHPANILVDKDGTINYVDFGIIGKLSPKERRYTALAMLNAALLDAEGAVKALTKIAARLEDADLEKFEKDVNKVLMDIEDSAIADESFANGFMRIVNSALENGVLMPSKFVVAGKALLTVEGAGLKIHPGFQPRKELKGLIEGIVIKQNSPGSIVKDFVMNLLENRDLIDHAPEKIDDALEGMKHLGEKKEDVSVDIDTRKISEAIVAGSLVIGGLLVYVLSTGRWAQVGGLLAFILGLIIGFLSVKS
ncbi:MAG: AarF/UbiB family protein [Candidatus Nanohaloarchaea archaeon]|nr:AarF/UbiB family protein [Candidatus Nanohaloarchaea archaeon]